VHPVTKVRFFITGQLHGRARARRKHNSPKVSGCRAA
jgi:hypothetical protein